MILFTMIYYIRKKMPKVVSSRKASKTLLTFIPEEFFGIYKDFEKYAKKDKRFLKDRIYSSKYIISLAVRTLINAYVQQQKMKEEEKNGETNIIDSQEEN